MSAEKQEDNLGTTTFFNNEQQHTHKFILWGPDDLLTAMLKFSQLDINGNIKAAQKQFNSTKKYT